MSRHPLLRELLETVLLAGVGVGVAVLVQRPDVRAALLMRAASYARRACQAQADLWQSWATASAQAYHRARL